MSFICRTVVVVEDANIDCCGTTSRIKGDHVMKKRHYGMRRLSSGRGLSSSRVKQVEWEENEEFGEGGMWKKRIGKLTTPI